MSTISPDASCAVLSNDLVSIGQSYTGTPTGGNFNQNCPTGSFCNIVETFFDPVNHGLDAFARDFIFSQFFEIQNYCKISVQLT